MPPGADIASNLEDVGRRLRAAAVRSGRNADEILLVAVSKTVSADVVRAAAAAGQRHFGENRVQEGLDKVSATGGLQLDWHLIGHLQSNKAKKAASAFAWIHSIDSVELLRKVDSAAAEAGARPRVLIQVDLAHESTKFGADEANVGDIAKAAMDAKAVDLRGLMIVPPIADNAEESRPWFRRLRDLRDALVAAGTPAANLAHLSMGMSHDFEVAIGEGATIVRVGTSIFGRRAPVA
jgi:pyridoxal phosphate enzyme (YggS family)